MASISVRKVAIILGAGPGTGAGVARAFAPTHALALLSRKKATLDATLASLPKDAQATAIEADAANPESIRAAFKAVNDKWPGATIDLAVYNAGGTFRPGPFLEANVEDLRTNLEGGVLGAFIFARCFLEAKPKSGTLIFTGATMSIKGSAKFGTMAPSKFALRALSQSLAREFGPQGIHICHAIIDGLIDTDRVKGMMGDAKEDATRLSPDSIGKAYRYLYEQDPSAFTQEIDLRPAKEIW